MLSAHIPCDNIYTYTHVYDNYPFEMVQNESVQRETEKHIKTTLKIQFYEIFPIQKIKKHF